MPPPLAVPLHRAVPAHGIVGAVLVGHFKPHRKDAEPSISPQPPFLATPPAEEATSRQQVRRNPPSRAHPKHGSLTGMPKEKAAAM